MPVMLRTQDGYYAEIVEIDGSKFRIADLGDHWDEFVDLYAALRQSSGMAEVTTDGIFDPKKLMAAMQAIGADRELQKTIRREMAELIDWMLGVCLVGWDLPVEIDAEVKRALPAAVKSALARAIVKASQLSVDEATFPGGLGAGDGGGR